MTSCHYDVIQIQRYFNMVRLTSDQRIFMKQNVLQKFSESLDPFSRTVMSAGNMFTGLYLNSNDKDQ